MSKSKILIGLIGIALSNQNIEGFRAHRRMMRVEKYSIGSRMIDTLYILLR